MTVDQIIKFYGGKTKAAHALDYTLQTFRDWRKSGIPERTQAWIQFRSGGKLKMSNGKDARK